MNLLKEWQDAFKNIKIPKLFLVLFLAIILYSMMVRIQGLGYSGFQGDEVNPMTFLYEYKDPGFNFGKYLMAQKRGPGQYVINYINVKLFGYHNEWQIRFPYLVFGLLAFYTFYNLAKKLFDETTALFIVVLLAINGLFLAFSRITQYQAFIYFIVPIGIYMFIKALEENSRKKFAVSGILMTLSLLGHYDTLATLPFFITVFLGDLYRKMDGYSLKIKGNKKLIRNTLINMSMFFALMIIPAFSYYIPYHLTKSVNDGTNSYLEGRLLGGGLMPRTSITVKLVSMYIPVVHLLFLFVSEMVGLFYLGGEITKFKIYKFSLSKKYLSLIYSFLILLLFASTIFSFYPIKPRLSSVLVIGSSLALTFILFISKKIKPEYAGLVAWALGSFSFYFFIMKDPRTHVYISFIPSFFIVGYGISELVKSLKTNYQKYILYTLLSVVFLFSSVFNWLVFVDKTPEYPWNDKYIFGWNLYHIDKVRHKKIDGVFGFNQYRAWDYLGKLYDEGCLTGNFLSNEKDSVTYFYVRRHQLDPENNYLLSTYADNLVPIDGPHSWYYSHAFDESYAGYYKLFELDIDGSSVMRIFGDGNLYPEGKFLCDQVPEFTRK